MKLEAAFEKQQCFETSDGAPNYVTALFQQGLRFMAKRTGNELRHVAQQRAGLRR